MTEYMLTRGQDLTGNLTAAGKLLFTPIKRADGRCSRCKDLNALFESLGELVGIALNSLYVFLLPTAIAAALGTPVAIYLYRRDGKTAEAVEAIINGLVAMPTTLPSLLLYLPLARTGPLPF